MRRSWIAYEPTVVVFMDIGLTQDFVRTIKRSKRQPIWVPGPRFPDGPIDGYEQMKPYLLGKQVLWLHSPSQEPSTWRATKDKEIEFFLILRSVAPIQRSV